MTFKGLTTVTHIDHGNGAVSFEYPIDMSKVIPNTLCYNLGSTQVAFATTEDVRANKKVVVLTDAQYEQQCATFQTEIEANREKFPPPVTEVAEIHKLRGEVESLKLVIDDIILNGGAL